MNELKKGWLNYSLDEEDVPVSNHTYKAELYLLKDVQSGNIQKIREQCAANFPEYPNPLGSYEKKNEEYMAVATITLLSRCVIPVGITSVESFRLSDYFLTKLSQAQKISDIIQIRNQAIISFTELVHERRQNAQKSNIYVEECKQYIAAHIFKKIIVPDIADSIGVNSIYLERVFKENTGVTISSYIAIEKMERAKNLLIYSDRSITEISDYLSFSSQSHFGQVFKKVTGKTPNQYRLEHHVSSF